MELLALGGLAAIGYFMSKRPVGNRFAAKDTHRPLSEQDVVPKRFEDAKSPYKTGVFSDRVFVEGMPPPMFKSRSLVHDEGVTFKKLELFTGSAGTQGGINLRQNKSEKGAIFSPLENAAPVSFSGTSGNILFSDIDRDRYQAGVGNLQTGVSCTTQEREIPALQQDPLFTYSPYIPHQKPGAHALPMPSEGFETRRPGADERPTEVKAAENRLRKDLPHTYDTALGANAAGRDVYPNQAKRPDQVLVDNRTNRKNFREYTGHGKSLVEEETSQMYLTREVEDRGQAIDYFGSGTRSFGPQDIPVPGSENYRRQNSSVLPVGHAAATGVLPETGKATFGEYQLRNKTGSDLSTGSAPMRRPFSVMGQQGPADRGPMRPKKYGGEFEARLNEVSRNMNGTERLEFDSIKERFETGPLNVGVPGSAALPQAYMDSTYASNAECNERVWVQDAPLRGATGDQPLGQGLTEHKRCETTFDTTVLQPTGVANPETLPETLVVTKDGCRVPVENAYVPLTMLQSS
jgi:hypothetical protein